MLSQKLIKIKLWRSKFSVHCKALNNVSLEQPLVFKYTIWTILYLSSNTNHEYFQTYYLFDSYTRKHKVFEWTFKICKHEGWINCRKVSDSLIDRLSICLGHLPVLFWFFFFTLKSDISLKGCSPCSVDLLPFTSKKTTGLQLWIMGYYERELGTVDSKSEKLIVSTHRYYGTIRALKSNTCKSKWQLTTSSPTSVKVSGNWLPQVQHM